jgi:predicted phosphoadenosine phosphosulfate sulfurtransferase
MGKIYQTTTTREALEKRLEYIFEEFDNVLVAFSCGKDSGVLLNAAYDYAKRTNQMHKLAYYYQDYEANYKFTHEYAERTFSTLNECRRYWLCLPFSAACAVSMHQTRWIPWDADDREIWVRDMPKGDYVVNMENCPFPFVKGTKGFDTRIIFSTWYAQQHGKTAVLVGLRADESLSRLAVITSSQRKFMHKGCRHSKIIDENTVNFYPIYDWSVGDIWVANARHSWDYNKIYDLYHMAGLTPAEMRVASPFHSAGQGSLQLYKAIDADSWARMVGRVNGVNFCAIYGGTTAMGWKQITKPSHFTWKQYAEFLLSTLPDAIRKKYIEKIEKSQWHWRVQGGARSQEFIEQLEREGWKIRRTHEKANRGHRKDELVYIDEMEDDTSVEEFRRAPTWKRVCITIMKNDTTAMFMGFQRTKDQMLKRKNALEKYKNL